MKSLFKNWRKLLKEGEVIQFPQQSRISEENLQFIIQLEDQIATKLAELHDNMASIPLEKIERLVRMMDDLEELLKQ